MKSKNNKRKLARVLSTFTVRDMTTTESRDDSAFDHDEADITMISYVNEAAKCGNDVMRVLSDDTGVFVLLVYWVYREEMTSKVQMERWDGTVLDINATRADLGPQCLQLLGMHAISGCDTTSYPCAKGKFSALKTMLDGDFPGLDDVLGEVGATHDDLLKTAMSTFFLARYGQPAETSIESARFTLYIRNMCHKPCCGKQTTDNHLPMNRCISLTSVGRFGMMSRCLMLLREIQLRHSGVT